MSLNLTFAVLLLGGWLFSRVFRILRLPTILGMVLFGIALGAVAGERVSSTLWEVEPLLKSLALIVILLRAGLGLKKEMLQRAGVTAVLMTFVPCVCEGAVLTVLFRSVFAFPWEVAGLTAFMLAAVSPAVIVPSMLELIERGYGQRHGVPSIVLAGASADDVFAITLFSVFLGLATSEQVSISGALLSIPLSIGVGVLSGVILGTFLVRYFRAAYTRVRATEKTLVLLTGAMLLVQIGDWTHTAALLGVMTVGFLLLERAEEVAHELGLKLKKVWIFAEIVLFVLIGLSVDLPTAVNAGARGLLVLAGGLVARSVGVLIATAFSSLDWRERAFCVIAYLPKATVQAALGSVALQHGVAQGEVILAIAVLSIVVTAPLGLFGIKILGTRLLDMPFHTVEGAE